MSRQRRYLQEHLLQAGFDLSSAGPEEDRIVCRWLRTDLRKRPAGWRALLPEAIELGRCIYRTFIAAYTQAFLQPDGEGVRLVHRFLRGRFGFIDEHAQEAVLERIRNRRLELLQHLRNKTQPTLFGPAEFDPDRLPGYLRRVAWVESLHVPTHDLPWNRQRLVGTDPAADRPTPAVNDSDIDYLDLAEQLSAFWGTANGFTREQHLEGLISLGLGRLTGEPILQQRSEELLALKLPAWELKLVQLRRRDSQLLGRWEELREHLVAAPRAEQPGVRQEMARVEALLQRSREMLAWHLTRLRPRPGEVGQLLTGFVGQRTGTVRHARINREKRLLRQRVHDGWAHLRQSQGALPADVQALGSAIAAHLGGEPASPRQHKLSSDEKRARRQQMRAWLTAALELLARIRGQLRSLLRKPAACKTLGETLESWLADAEDLYELGVLGRKGIIQGLGRRHGWRLPHLLRQRAHAKRSRGSPRPAGERGRG